MKRLLPSFVALCLSLVTPLVASAQTTHSVCAAGCDFTTVAAAIAGATAGDTIEVTDAVHTEGGITLNKDLTIRGTNALGTIVQAAATAATATQRVFNVNSGVTATLEALTIRHGFKQSDGGGGIRNVGTLTITGSTIIDNQIGNPFEGGGGIYTTGTLTLLNSTVTGNSTTNAEGGGIYSTGTTDIVFSSIVGNTSGGGGASGGGIRRSGGTVTLKNTIVANNAASHGGKDCDGTVVSAGYNLIETTTDCTITGDTTGNLTGLDPALGALVDNGGPTETFFPAFGSPAVDASADCTDTAGSTVTTDQRGTARPLDGDADATALCDIGAVEADFFAPLNFFTATEGVSDIVLDWQTIMEDGNSGFDVEHHAGVCGSGTFATLTTVASQGDASTPQDYSYAATGLMNTDHCFRLRVSSTDGRAYHSEEVGEPLRSAPLNFFSFTPTGGDMVLDWQTAKENGNSGFDVEHHTGVCGSGTFATLASIAGAGTIATPQDYSHTASGLALGDHCFRLEQTDTDGLVTFSEEIDARFPVTYTVCAAGCDFSTIAAAVAGAVGGDLLDLQDAVYTESAITLDKDLTIQGQGADQTIVQANASAGVATARLFTIDASTTVTLRDLTLRHGKESLNGGALLNNGTLTLQDCTVVDNQTTSFGGRGGAVKNAGTLIVERCTFSDNQTSGVDAFGGAIHTSGTLTIRNSTFDANQVTGGGGEGAALYSTGTTSIAFSTITGNTATGSGGLGGGIRQSGGTVTLKNTILAGNANKDCDGTVVSAGYNLIETTTGCTITGDTTGNLTGVDPLLGDLQDNGGPTETRLPTVGSPALDASNDCTDTSGGAVSADQRGKTRPFDGTNDAIALCDIGAVEALYFAPLNSFTVIPDDIDMDLAWQTVFENGNSGFDVEHHAGVCGSGTFATLTTVASQGNASTPQDYAHTVSGLALGAHCFRLHAVSNGGAEALSGEVDAQFPVTHTVCASGCDFTTISDAIAAVSAGDAIEVQDGVHTEAGIVVDKDVTIHGLGADVTTVQAAVDLTSSTTRVFKINSGFTATIRDMTIQHGKRTGNNEHGGGIHNAGTLTLTNVTLRDNKTTGLAGFGGGIYNTGTLTLTSSTLQNNKTNGGSSDGGGIYTTGTLTINNSTFDGNEASTSAGDGGGLYSTGTTNIAFTTFSNNTANYVAGKGGNIRQDGGTVTLKNSILAGGSVGILDEGPDCHGTITSAGYNLIENTTDCTITGDTTGNLTGVDPLLGDLQDNGGPTFTRVLAVGSPALDASNDCTDTSGGAVSADQRGKTRPFDGTGDGSVLCDIGAFEGIYFAPLNSFTATNVFTDMDLAWQTAFENGNSGFDVEHHAGVCGSGTFATLTTVASQGNASTPQDYAHTVSGLALGAHCFRLHAVSNGGEEDLSVEVEAVMESAPLNSFTAAIHANGVDVDLAWQTAFENGNSGFDVEHHVGVCGSGTFATLTTVASQGDAAVPQDYTHTATGLAGADHCFRLRQADTGGGEYFSAEQELHFPVTHTVCASGCDFTTVAAAIAAVTPSDIVTLPDAVYTEGGITLNKDLTIRGTNALGTIVQAAATAATATQRVFNVNSGVTATLEALTIRHGFKQSDGGGGIRNVGTLTITGSTIIDNQIGNPFEGGGGIYTTGTLTLLNSTVTGNSTTNAEGGGIYSTGTTDIVFSSIVGNTSGGGGASGGGIRRSGGTVTLKNTIVANNAASHGGEDCDGTVVSAGYNLIETTTDCTITGDTTGNLTGVDPVLGALDDNGGSTETFALMPGSPAIDASADCTDTAGSTVTTDQRGEPRFDGACDLGAYEADTPLPVELTGFEALRDGPDLVLVWHTTAERDNLGFTVEHRPANDSTWHAGAFVEGHGTTSEAHTYRHRLAGLAIGAYRFRLKQIDRTGNHVYSAEIAVTMTLPKGYRLSSVYPNPFNPQAQFTLALAEAQAVTIAVFDVLGRQVATLYRGLLSANETHRFVLDGSPLASGTYLVRVVGASLHEVRPVVLIK